MSILRPELYTVAWIAPLEIEARAALLVLDHRHEGRFPVTRGDDYVFQAGDISGHNVIIATLPAGQEYGTGSAAALSSQVKRFFPNLWFGLLVGVAAGLPDMNREPQRDIRLGDVLVGLPDTDHAGLIAYDLGKETGKDGLKLLRCGQVLANTETVVRSAIGSIKLRAPNDARLFLQHYEAIKDEEHIDGTFADPGEALDMLYHIDDNGGTKLVQRAERPASRRTRVWYGAIGSGDKLMKSALIKDQLRDRYNLIGLEMEAAGMMNRIPVGVVRGVCDYADEYKNKIWQPYASAMAAAYAKAILHEIPAKDLVTDVFNRTPSEQAIGNDNAVVGNTRKRQRLDDDPDSRHTLSSSTEDTMIRPIKRHKSNKEDTYAASSTGPSRKRTERRQKQIDEDQRIELIESLLFDEIDNRQRSVRAPHDNTCRWLTESPEWRNWLDPKQLDNHNGFLWIKGKPGTGKSTLMGYAHSQTAINMADKMTTISFFFSARGTDLEKSIVGLYRSLIAKLIAQLPDLECVFDLVQNSGEEDFSRYEWTVESLTLLLQEAMKKLGDRPLICFIDGLDECDEQQIRDMVSFFEVSSKLARSSGSEFYICLASRHYPHITIEKGLEIILDTQIGHDQDITQYLNDKLRVLPLGFSKALQNEVREKAAGIFMWVVLVVGILNKEHDRGHTHSLRQRIQEIPDELHALFRDIFTRDNHNPQGLLLCIQWVLFAKRPLSPQELYLAILASTEPEHLKDWHVSPFCKSIEAASNFILNISKGLVKIVQDEQPTVQFIHESVREFIQQGDGLGQIFQDRKELFNGLSHSALARSCLNYIEISVSVRRGHEAGGQAAMGAVQLRDSLITSWPFLQYATEHILYHAGVAQVGGVSQTQFLQEFRLRDWVSHHHLLLDRGSREEQKSRLKKSYLYTLVKENKTALLRLFIPNRDCLDTGEWQHRASIMESIATDDAPRLRAHMKALMGLQKPKLPPPILHEDEVEGSPQMPNTEHLPRSWETRVIFSALNQDDDTTLAFILAGTNIEDNSKDEYGRTLMMVARSVEVVKVLSDCGADLTAKENGRTLLTYFALRNHYAIVELLIDRGADVNQRNDRGETALCAVAGDGGRSVASLLIEKGADIESRGDDGLTPLAWAARSGNISVAAFLLDKGALPNSIDNDRRTPLIWATQNQHPVVLAMLLKKGSDPNLADKEGRTPLSWAAEYGNCHIIYILLENGASAEHGDCLRQSPLVLPLKRNKLQACGLLRGWIAAKSPQERHRLLRYTPAWRPRPGSMLAKEYRGTTQATPVGMAAHHKVSNQARGHGKKGGGPRSGYN